MYNKDIGSEIIPNLYIGNMYTAKNKMFFNKNGIKAVLNLTTNVPNYFACPNEKIEYMRINVKDSLKEEDFIKMYNYLPCIFSFIYKNLILENKPVLVHCHAGVQRSATAVAAFLMKYNKLPLNTVVKFIISKRPVVFNFGRSINFYKPLLKYQQQLLLTVK
jgi:protein-tyrosine phosphatase